MNIDNIFFPENGELKKKDGVATAIIVDPEIDPIDCIFNNDGCVNLNTENYSYLTLSVENLENLIELIYESEEYYQEYFERKQ